MFLDLRQHLAAIRRLIDYINVAFERQKLLEAISHDRVIVSNQDANPLILCFRISCGRCQRFTDFHAGSIVCRTTNLCNFAFARFSY